MPARMSWRFALAVMGGLSGLPPGAVRADDKDRFVILEENDSLFFNSDKHYTQGLRLSNLSPSIGAESGWNGPFDWAGGILPVFREEEGGQRSRRYSLLLGQNLFTPKNLAIRPPERRDRPYAGWLYAGVSLLQESAGFHLENLELDLGIVGPGALGKQVQNDFHQLIGAQTAEGWSKQIQNEPGVMLSYERLWRLHLIGDGDNGVDFVPQAGATVGNIFTYGDVGGMLRIGRHLSADYGPVRIRPALSGTDYFEGARLDGDFGYYIYAGTQGRVVGLNIFLDGNSFRQSASIEKKDLVADFQAGIAFFWSTAFRLDFSVVRRTREFAGQSHPDEIGTAAFSFSW